MFDSIFPISIVIIAVSMDKSAMTIEIIVLKRPLVYVTLYDV
jgi:hypothetical protein